MKKILLSLSLIAITSIAKAQCTDLIISEYIEGTNNNKALELYNPTTSPINLVNYRILRHDNGNNSFTPIEGEMKLPTNIILAPSKTYVIALNLTDPNGTGQTAPIDAALQAKADTLLCPGCATGTGNSRVMCFNGDDALALQKNVSGTWVDVDIFACRGEQPTNSAGTASPTAGWTSLPPYWQMPVGYTTVANGPYFKQYWTQDKTLIRKNSVKMGVTVNPIVYSTTGVGSFNPSLEWDSLAVNTFTNLGIHNCSCPTVGLKELSNLEISTLYPNPAKNVFYIQSPAIITGVFIINVTGQIVKTIHSQVTLANSAISLEGLEPGIYFVTLKDERNFTTVKKLIAQ